MTGKEIDYVRERVENEGFDYCFRHYSTFDDVKDEEFHKLRAAYVETANKLAEYLNLDEG
jgi:dsRNA-specific ribonuclease